MCWGTEEDPPLAGELISDPKGAKPGNNPKRRATDVDPERKHLLSEDVESFSPATCETQCADDNAEHDSWGSVTGPCFGNIDKDFANSQSCVGKFVSG